MAQEFTSSTDGVNVSVAVGADPVIVARVRSTSWRADAVLKATAAELRTKQLCGTDTFLVDGVPYEWDAASTATDDSSTAPAAIQIAGVTTGRYVRRMAAGTVTLGDTPITALTLGPSMSAATSGGVTRISSISVANFAALSTVPAQAGDVIQLLCHTTAGDGGGGTFDAISDPGNTYVADGGTVARNGTIAFVRRESTNAEIKAEWFGGDRTGAVDLTAYLRARLASLISGQTLRLPRINFKVTDTIVYDGIGTKIVGAGGLHPDPGSTGTTILAYLPTWSGTAATIASIATNAPTGELALVTLTGLGDITGVLPGDVIRITGATLEQNNGVFTIVSVDSGSVVYYGVSNRVHVSAWQVLTAITGETNNGSLHWEIRKPVFRLRGRDIEIRGVSVHGRDTASECFDCSAAGANGTPTVASTDIRFVDIRAEGAFDILKIGDFSGYIAGGSSFSWAGNHDLYRFRDCAFRNYDHAGIYIPNNTGNSMLHAIRDVTCSYGEMGICIRRGSFSSRNFNFTGNRRDIEIKVMSNPITIIGGSSEHSASLLGLGQGGYLAVGTGPFPITIDGIRFGSEDAELAGDGCVIATSHIGGLALRNCNFGSVPSRLTIGVLGYTSPSAAINRQVALSIEGCIFPTDLPEKIVTSKVGAPGGPFDVWYYSRGNTVLQGTNVPRQCPNGILRAYLSPGTPYPQTTIGNLVTPAASVTIAAGAVVLANPYRSSVTLTGPTGAVTSLAIGAGEHGQRLRLRLQYNYTTTLKHLDASATAGTRLMTPSASDIVLFAPGASPAYHTIEFEYDTTVDSGNGAWVTL